MATGDLPPFGSRAVSRGETSCFAPPPRGRFAFLVEAVEASGPFDGAIGRLEQA